VTATRTFFFIAPAFAISAPREPRLVLATRRALRRTPKRSFRDREEVRDAPGDRLAAARGAACTRPRQAGPDLRGTSPVVPHGRTRRGAVDHRHPLRRHARPDPAVEQHRGRSHQVRADPVGQALDAAAASLPRGVIPDSAPPSSP
jgi:hypothetical protein